MTEDTIIINPNFNFQQNVVIDKSYTCKFFGHFELTLVYTSTDSQLFSSQVDRSTFSPVVSVRFFTDNQATYFSFCCQNICILIHVTKNEPIVSLIKSMSKQSVILYINFQDYQRMQSLVPELKKIPDKQFNEICQEYTSVDRVFFDPLNLQNTGNDVTFAKFLFISHSLISTFYVRRNYFPVSLFSNSYPVDCPSRSYPDFFEQFNANNIFFLRILGSQQVNLCFERTLGYLCVRKFYQDRALYEKEKSLKKMFHYHPNIINCFGFIDDDPNFQPSLLFEFASNSSLDNFIESGVNIDNTIKSRMLYQILGALDYLHTLGVVHQQLIPENILITSNYDAYISHFSTSRIYFGEGRFDRQNGFLFYDDLALYGVLIYEIANMKLLWNRNTPVIERLNFVLENRMQYLSIEFGSIVSLYEKCVRDDLSNRLCTFIYLSQFRLYYYYFYGAELCGLFQDFEQNQLKRLHKSPIRKDVEYVQYRSANGDPESMYRIGIFYREGYYLDKDINASRRNFKKACNYGLPGAFYELIKEYFSGVENGYNLIMCKSTLEYYSTLNGFFKLKFLYSKYLLDNEKDDNKEINKALNLIIQIAKVNVDAQVLLSELIFEGKFYKKEDNIAFGYLKEATKQASPEAVFKLATIYENGIPNVVDKNDQMALKYYFLAGSLRNEEALKVLVNKYVGLNGNDKIYAFRILKNAAKQKIFTGLKFIGIMYKDWAESKDNNDPEDRKRHMLEKGLKYLTATAERGDMDSLFEMAVRYYRANGVAQDLTLAFKFYKKYQEMGGEEVIKEFDHQPE